MTQMQSKVSEPNAGNRARLIRALRATLLSGVLIFPLAVAAQAPSANCCDGRNVESWKVGGDYGNQNYSALSKITRSSVKTLGGAWHLQAEGGNDQQFQQGNLVAAGGVIYAETTQGSTLAIDGATGVVKWRYKPAYPATLRRGVALGEGKVFTLKGGNRVIALDHASGKVIWEKQFPADRGTGTMPTAVTYYNGMIFFGTANSARGLGIALRASDGEEIWRFYGPAAPGEVGGGTWAENTWQTGGAAPWQHPAVDPENGLIFWTFGNARAGSPLDGTTREGQNLFANSLVAIDAKTGKHVWHFQSVHHDIWDMDNVMAPVLIDLTVGGKPRKAVVYGSKTGMLYILDRKTGEPIFPIDEKPVPQEPRQHTWPTQPITRNEPLLESCPTGKGAGAVPPHYIPGCLFTPHWDTPVVHFPGTGGGADTSAYSYSHKTGLLYVGVGIVGIAQARVNVPNIGQRPYGEERAGRVVAYNPATGKVAWSKPMEWALAHGNGVLSTAGDVLFIGQPDGYLLALDAANGKELWRFQTGAGVHTTPVTYEVAGEQYVAVMAGGNGIPYNSPKGDHIWAFKLGGKAPPAAAPTPPPKRQPILAAAIPGSVANNTVTLGRIWENGVGTAESIAQNAIAPQVLEVPKGTTVTFVNPADNKQDRCATQFFEGLFGKTPLKPAQSFTYQFNTTGEFYFNDCAAPLTTGKVVVK
jgi:PQQ-dependent dehydrogenase (methanol/ethanol family)